MKRMKALLSVVMALAMVLSLGLTAFASGVTQGTIEILNPPENVASYDAYQVFTAATNNNDVVYTIDDTIWTEQIDYDDAVESGDPTTAAGAKAAIDAAFAELANGSKIGITNVTTDYEEIESYRLVGVDTAGKVTIFEKLAVNADTGVVEALTGYSAADFAKWLKEIGFDAIQTAVTIEPDSTITDTNDPNYGKYTADVDPGYYWILPDGFDPATQVSMLTTVLPGKTVGVHNKNDMPFDKDVAASDAADAPSIDDTGVKVGDILYYTITTKVPTTPDNTTSEPNSIFYITDLMSEGLEFIPESLTVTIADNHDPDDPYVVINEFTEAPDDMFPLIGDYYRIAKNGYTFELSVDVSSAAADGSTLPNRRSLAGKTMTITYQARVTPEAIVGILDNYANLEYTDATGEIVNKDDTTHNYMSRIIIDKFENGEPEQKLAGAEFVLRNADGKYYQANKFVRDVDGNIVATQGVEQTEVVAGPFTGNDAKWETVEVVKWVDNLADATVMVTGIDGEAYFYFLEDGTYDLIETKAPTGYTQLPDPIQIVINGKDSVDPTLSDAQRAMLLMNTSHVANTPGTVLPSTGGRGTTMLYMAGLGMMLAAGAFLIFRRRAEAGK